MGGGLKRVTRAVSASTRDDPDTNGDQHSILIEERGGDQSDQNEAACEPESLGDGAASPEHPPESHDRGDISEGIQMRKRNFSHCNGGNIDINSTGTKRRTRAKAADTTVILESAVPESAGPTCDISRRKAPSGADLSEANSSSEHVQPRDGVTSSQVTETSQQNIRESKNFHTLSSKRGDERKSNSHMQMEAGLLGAKKPSPTSAIEQPGEPGEVPASFHPLPFDQHSNAKAQPDTDALDIGGSAPLNDNMVYQSGVSCETSRDQLQLEPGLKDLTNTQSSRVVHFEFSRQAQKQQPSVSQLKNALFLESSRASRSADAERLFAKYWESLEQYITSALSSGENRSRFAVEDALSTFLTTEKLKYLHNKLLLGECSANCRHFSFSLLFQTLPLCLKQSCRRQRGLNFRQGISLNIYPKHGKVKLLYNILQNQLWWI